MVGKRLAERLACALLLPRAGRTLYRKRTLVLAYHNIVPDGEPVVGDRSLHLPRADFARQLDALARTHDVVPLESILDGLPGSGRPRVVITFDDAYRGALEVGVEELARRGMPATFFVAPAFVGGGSFWWDAVAASMPAGLTPQTRQYCIDELAGKDAAIREWAVGSGIEPGPVPEHQTVATEAHLARAAAIPGITFASHSWSHPNLARIAPDELRTELTASLDWLRARFAPVVPWLSLPYGCGSNAVREAAAQAGYVGALEITGGWLPASISPADRYALPRLNIPAGVSAEGFELRASGMIHR